ncbi:choline kinase [Rhodoferax saidenbachensis]|uniref:Choline kinase n=2 Tax=Rhodoferax saidenbachensis TaxID=1484693 RepID=A0ABU1ZKH2_9BURK|nr:choline kinase [Rhodoferax saidenbachensis]
MRLIVLAAGQGTRLRPLTDDRPKCLVELGGRPLLEWQIATAREAGIDDIVVIGGYKIDHLKKYDVKIIENPKFATTNMVRTLFCAQNLFEGGFIMSYGDIVYSPAVLKHVLADEHAIAVTVDKQWRSYWERRLEDPLSDAETLKIDVQGNLFEVGQKPQSYADVQAQYIGLVAFREAGVKQLNATYANVLAEDAVGKNPFGGKRNLDMLYMTDLLQGMIKNGVPLHALPIDGGWVEVDSVSDLTLAEKLLTEGRLG